MATNNPLDNHIRKDYIHVMAKRLYILETKYGQAFFDEDENLLTAWHENDANWRNEYMDSLVEALGYDVMQAPKVLRSRFIKKVKTRFQGLC